MNTRAQLLCAWSGPFGLLIFLIGVLPFAHFVPPPSPAHSAQQIADFYADNQDGIRIGAVLTMIGGTLTGVFAAGISAQMKRVEGAWSPLAYAQLAMGVLNVAFFLLPAFGMVTLAFRTGLDPNTARTFNDFTCLMIVGAFSGPVAQALLLAICVFLDTGEEVFPRWLGYYSAWAALLLLPVGLVFFFKTGPFAWNGLVSFWMPVVDFLVWYLTVFFVLRRTILHQALNDPGARLTRLHQGHTEPKGYQVADAEPG